MSLPDQRGFSLIELAVVVLIAGLVLMFTMPSINRFLIEMRLRDARSRIAGELRLARQKSVTNTSRTWFVASVGTNTYFVGEQRWNGSNPDSSIGFGTTQWKGPYALPSTVRIAAANWAGLNYFWFTPKGQPTNNATSTPVSGTLTLVSTVGAPDTLLLNLDLSGSVW